MSDCSRRIRNFSEWTLFIVVFIGLMYRGLYGPYVLWSLWALCIVVSMELMYNGLNFHLEKWHY